MPTKERQEKIERLIQQRQQGIMVFEDIHDPHNAAAVLRRCDGFGFHQAYFIFQDEKPYNPARVGKSSSSSANRWLQFKTFDSTKTCLESLRTEGYEIVATALTDKAENLFESDFTQEKIALVFGNEHRGVSDDVLALAHRVVKIPMTGMVQSFNLSVTAALVMYEITRQRREQGLERYVYPPESQQYFQEVLLKREDK